MGGKTIKPPLDAAPIASSTHTFPRTLPYPQFVKMRFHISTFAILTAFAASTLALPLQQRPQSDEKLKIGSFGPGRPSDEAPLDPPWTGKGGKGGKGGENPLTSFIDRCDDGNGDIMRSHSSCFQN